MNIAACFHEIIELIYDFTDNFDLAPMERTERIRRVQEAHERIGEALQAEVTETELASFLDDHGLVDETDYVWATSESMATNLLEAFTIRRKAP